MTYNRENKESFYFHLLRDYYHRQISTIGFTAAATLLENKFKTLDRVFEYSFLYSNIALSLVNLEEKNNGQLPEHLQTIINEIILETM